MNDVFSDADVISSYTSEQAIDDGVLVEAFPKQFPKLLLTNAVFTTIEEKIEGTQRTLEQAIIPLFQDAVMLFRAAQKKDPNEYLVTKGLEGNVTGKDLWVAMNEYGGLTIMFPEDY